MESASTGPNGGHRKHKRTHKHITLRKRAKTLIKLTRLSSYHKKRTQKKKHVRPTTNRSKRLRRH
jgi:hypothetical protein